MNTWLSTHAKAIVGLVFGVITYLVSTYPTNVDVQHWGGIVLALLGAAGVYATPNAASSVATTKKRAGRVPAKKV